MTIKGNATKAIVCAIDTATGAKKTGDAANITINIMDLDTGTVSTLTDTSAAEISSTNAPGFYLADVTAGEYNADRMISVGKSSTSGVTIIGFALGTAADVVGWKGATAPANTGDAYARLGAPSGASIAADIDAIPTAAENVAAIEAAVVPVDVTQVNGVAVSVQTDLATTTDVEGVPAAVWSYTTRTLSSFGSLVADTATAVWSAGTRTLSSFGTLATDAAAAVWAYATRILTAGTNISIPSASDNATATWAAETRTLSSFGTLVSDVATAVWAAGTRTLSSFGTLVSDIATAVWAASTRTLTSGGGGGATAQEVWEYGSRTLTGSGGGSVAYTIDPVTDGTNPILGARVVVTTDVAGADKVDEQFTDEFGVCTFFLDPGAYYLWIAADGRISLAAQQIEVTV